MKKTLLVLLGAVCAASLSAAILAGCSDKNRNEEGGSDDGYTITVQSGEGYTASADKKEAEFGENVTVTITVTDPDKYIDAVLANGTEISGKDGVYTTIVTADTTFTVTLADYTEKLTDGGLAFRTNNDTTIVMNSNNNGGVWDSENSEFVYTLWDLTAGFSWSNTTSLSRNSKVTSSDQTVIPDDAITFAPAEKGSQSNVFSAVKITIDTTKISAGYTWLTMYFASGNSSSSNGTLCVKIAVVDKLVLETMQNGVTIDFGKYADEGDDILVRFYDSDYIEGSYIGDQPAPAYVQVAGKVGANGKATFNFEYIKGHEYTISICKGTEWFTSLTPGSPDRDRVLLLEDQDVISGGSSVTGYNQYVDGKLSFVTEGATLELTVEGTFDELN